MNKKEYSSPKTSNVLINAEVLGGTITLDIGTEKTTRVLSKGNDQWEDEDAGEGW